MILLRTVNGLLCACFLLVGLCGCVEGKPKRYAVSGEVKWQGKPLDQGAITFLANEAALGIGGALIKDGQYRIPAEHGLRPGHYKVMITSSDPKSRVVDPDSPPGYLPVPKDRIKPQYNAQTTLTADVTADGNNAFNFEVH